MGYSMLSCPLCKAFASPSPLIECSNFPFLFLLLIQDSAICHILREPFLKEQPTPAQSLFHHLCLLSSKKLPLGETILQRSFLSFMMKFQEP